MDLPAIVRSQRCGQQRRQDSTTTKLQQYYYNGSRNKSSIGSAIVIIVVKLTIVVAVVLIVVVVVIIPSVAEDPKISPTELAKYTCSLTYLLLVASAWKPLPDKKPWSLHNDKKEVFEQLEVFSLYCPHFDCSHLDCPHLDCSHLDCSHLDCSCSDCLDLFFGIDFSIKIVHV